MPALFAGEPLVAGSSAKSVITAPTQMPDGIVKMNGKPWLVKSSQRTLIHGSTELPGGAKIGEDGKITLLGGKNIEMKDGQFLTKDGDVLDTPEALKSVEDGTPAVSSKSAAVAPARKASTPSQVHSASAIGAE